MPDRNPTVTDTSPHSPLPYGLTWLKYLLTVQNRISVSALFHTAKNHVTLLKKNKKIRRKVSILSIYALMVFNVFQRLFIVL
jgi:hypothetical protein